MSAPPRAFVPGDRVSHQPVPDQPPELGLISFGSVDPSVVFVSLDRDPRPRPFHQRALALVEEPSGPRNRPRRNGRRRTDDLEA